MSASPLCLICIGGGPIWTVATLSHMVSRRCEIYLTAEQLVEPKTSETAQMTKKQISKLMTIANKIEDLEKQFEKQELPPQVRGHLNEAKPLVHAAVHGV